MVLILLFMLLSTVDAGPVQARVKLNTGQMMPLLNCGGTAQSTVPGNHCRLGELLAYTC